MRERDLFINVIAVLRTQLGPDIEIAQNNQPRSAGRPASAAILLELIGNRRYGHVKREDVPDPDDVTQMIHRETQIYEATIQVNGLAKPPPAQGAVDPDEPSALDWTDRAAAALQSDVAIVALAALDLGVLRVMNVRNPKFRNDREQYEASPSFDFILTHKQITVSRTPAAIVGELRVASV